MESSAGSSASADSYIGSLISLTSKSEMRYEGVLYNINTDECSIGLRNVRSFGTEGRKKDGPQVPPSDKVYEYILFCGIDIKDLQVKSSPPAPPINIDPAIIQSHYPRPPTTSPSFIPAASGPPTDFGSQTQQSGRANYQSGMPLYQPGSNLGPWGPPGPPPNAAGPGLQMPMYWQGYNFPPNGLPQMPEQSLLRPPPILPLQQPIQYPAFNIPSNLPEIPSSLLPPTTASPNLPPLPSIALSSETLPAISPLASSSTNPNPVVVPPITNRPNSFSTFSNPIISEPTSSVIETPTPSLVTPGQLLHSAPAAVSSYPMPLETANKDVEVLEISSKSEELSEPRAVEAQPPLLPLPQSSRVALNKPKAAPYQGRPAYRGRERGRGAGFSRQVTMFTEDFDFFAMNEKFNKDEVWGHLGKNNRSYRKGDEGSDEDDYEDEDYSEAAKAEGKPVYNKDDFFDSISSNSLDCESNNGRIRFSEQRKIDTETFGDFSRYRGGRGGHWHGRGGRYGGSYCGRGGYGGGYAVRGSGRGMSNA